MVRALLGTGFLLLAQPGTDRLRSEGERSLEYATKKTVAKKAATKKTAAKKAPSKKVASKRVAGGKSVSLTKEGKDPNGGLTAAGRKAYNDATGGHLKPGSEGCGEYAGEEAAEGLVSDASLHDASRARGEGWEADAAGVAGCGVG